VCLFELVFIIL